ncbi:MAG: AAA family ATPase [Euryarchaeota archaeon]|nr:AAA family ATPase [Euryarchaeota archaeon]
MKILIMGKGGSGKSTVATLLAQDLLDKGYRVLVIDTDESNYGLAAQLGVEPPVELMDHLGGKKALGEKMRAAFSKGDKEPFKKRSLFEESWGIDQVPTECISSKGALHLMQIGKVRHFGEGCACPMGGLSREFIERLRLGPKDIAIIDTEAGVEHLGRGVEKGVDIILAVLDPSYESLLLSGKMTEMAREAGKTVNFILNKVDDGDAELMKEKLPKGHVVAVFPWNRDVERKGLNGEPLTSSVPGLSDLTDFVLNETNAKVRQ